MTKKIISLALLFFLLIGCVKKKPSVVLDKKSFSIVNLISEFPTIDLQNILDKDDSLGLTCDKCVFNNEKAYFASVFIDRNNRSIEYARLGWNPVYKFKYDENNRIINQTITSCYNWNISYTYLDTLELIYQFSRLENEIDTTIYKLDSNGRVFQSNGVEYGDLYKRSFTKMIFYSGINSIPDSINSVFNIGSTVKEIKKEIFFQDKGVIDSIYIKKINYDTNNTKIQEFINYFDKHQMFTNQRHIHSDLKTNIFYVERLAK